MNEHATFGTEEFTGNNSSNNAQPRGIITPITKPIPFKAFTEKYNGGKPLQFEKVPTGASVAYVEHKQMVLPVWMGESVDRTQPKNTQVVKDQDGRVFVFVRNIGEVEEIAE